MAEGRRGWIAQPLSQGWWGAGIPPQRPELHQLQMPNGLHPRSSRVSSLWQLLSLGHELCDQTAQMGQDGHWTELAPPRPLSPSSAILPGMRHRKRCGKTLPHCSRASALISPEAAHLSDSLSVTMELWGWSCLPAPGAMGAFPSCPLPAASPSSCPRVKQIWAPAACLLGPRVHWPGSPKQEVHPEAQWPLWANWHLGQWGPGQRLHYLLQRGVREGRWSLLGR